MIYGLVVYASEIDDWLGRAKEITDLFEGDGSIKCSILLNDIDGHNANQVGTLCRKLSHGDILVTNSIASFTNLKERDLRELIDVLKCYSVNIYPLDISKSYEKFLSVKGVSLGTVKNFLLEYLESVLSHKTGQYEDITRKQREGIEKAKREGKYKGRPINASLHNKIRELRNAGFSIRKTAELAGTSPTTVQKVMKRGTDPHPKAEAEKIAS